MNLKGIMLSKISRSKGYIPYDFVYDNLEKTKLIRQRTDQYLPGVMSGQRVGLQNK